MPHVDMGPVLMKPVSATGAEIIVLGKSIGQMEARDYFADTSKLAAVAADALERLRTAHQVIVIEGAGSPVELNLWSRDYVNLRPARRAGAAIVLVVDIDKGGVFAQAKGTLDLLPEQDRARVLGIIVNRFRGDITLFDDGIPILEQICGVPVLAVVRHMEHGLDEEDRPLRIAMNAKPEPGKLHVGVLLYPRVSNTEDLTPLLAEPDVQLTWLTDARLIEDQDLLMLPGSKATIGDLILLTANGLTDAILNAHISGTWLLGICGGYQMLGIALHDEAGSEGGPREWAGLGMLPIETTFESEKLTVERCYKSAWPLAGQELSGYEIRHGRTRLSRAEGEAIAMSAGPEAGWRRGHALGSYLHGILANDAWRGAFLNQVRQDCGLPQLPVQSAHPLEQRIARWAEHFRRSLRPGALDRLLCAVRS